MDPLWKIIALRTILLLLTWYPDKKLLLNILIRAFTTSLRRIRMAVSIEYQNSWLKRSICSHGELLASHSFKLLIYKSSQCAVLPIVIKIILIRFVKIIFSYW